VLFVSAVARFAPAAEEAGGELVSLIVGLLSDQDKDLRAVGLEQIRGEAKGETATKAFAAQLPKLSADAQIGLLSALADRGDRAARPAVVELLQAKPAEPVKLAAIEALGALGDVGDLSLLLPGLSAESKGEQAATRAALIRLEGDQVARAIAESLKASNETALRVKLIQVLATRRALEVLPDFVALARNGDPTVRGAAIGALAQMGGPAQIPGMVAGVLAAKKGSERDAAERAIATVLGRNPDEAQRGAPLLAAVEALGKPDRTLLLPTVGRVGGEAALAVIEAALADTATHDVALAALCNWPDASIAPRLIELHSSEKEPKNQALVLAALVRIAPLADGRTEAQRLALLKRVMSMCKAVDDQNRVIRRARAIYTVDALRFVVPYLDQTDHAEIACETVVELAHHRDIREANKAEFTAALDKVLATSKDEVVRDRAQRYKEGRTWVRPKDDEKS
jgi:HEAT repeat protein